MSITLGSALCLKSQHETMKMEPSFRRPTKTRSIENLAGNEISIICETIQNNRSIEHRFLAPSSRVLAAKYLQ